MIQRRQFAKLAATGVSGAWASSALAQTAQPKTFVLIHGAWHALGYDHEEDPKAAKIMEDLEVELLSRFKVPNPYAP